MHPKSLNLYLMICLNHQNSVVNGVLRYLPKRSVTYLMPDCKSMFMCKSRITDFQHCIVNILCWSFNLIKFGWLKAVKGVISLKYHDTTATNRPYSLGWFLFPCGPRDHTLKNYCFQIFKLSRLHEWIMFSLIKEPFSRKYHVVYNENTNLPRKNCHLFLKTFPKSEKSSPKKPLYGITPKWWGKLMLGWYYLQQGTAWKGKIGGILLSLQRNKNPDLIFNLVL